MNRIRYTSFQLPMKRPQNKPTEWRWDIAFQISRSSVHGNRATGKLEVTSTCFWRGDDQFGCLSLTLDEWKAFMQSIVDFARPEMTA
jgi:hypothetical protein